jgi:hypothetical protein
MRWQEAVIAHAHGGPAVEPLPGTRLIARAYVDRLTHRDRFPFLRDRHYANIALI